MVLLLFGVLCFIGGMIVVIDMFLNSYFVIMIREYLEDKVEYYFFVFNFVVSVFFVLIVIIVFLCDY